MMRYPDRVHSDGATGKSSVLRAILVFTLTYLMVWSAFPTAALAEIYAEAGGEAYEPTLAAYSEGSVFTSGYVRVLTDTAVFTDITAETGLGTLREGTEVFALAVDEQLGVEGQWLEVLFDTPAAREQGVDPIVGFILETEDIAYLTEEEAGELQATLSADGQSRSRYDVLLPIADFDEHAADHEGETGVDIGDDSEGNLPEADRGQDTDPSQSEISPTDGEDTVPGRLQDDDGSSSEKTPGATETESKGDETAGEDDALLGVQSKSEETDPELMEGLWEYEIVGGYARVLGYEDEDVLDLTVPTRLGGYFVNAIAPQAFAKNHALASIEIGGNVTSIATDAFPGAGVTIRGYNGTEALAFARLVGLPAENLTNIEYFVLQDQVTDYTYAEEDSYEYMGEGLIRMRKAEAAQLSEGDAFYVPEVYGELMAIWHVESIQDAGDSVLITVSQAPADEALKEVHIDEDGLMPDWDRAEWADGAELVEEKVSVSSEITGSVPFTYKKSLGTEKVKVLDGSGTTDVKETNLKFVAEGRIALKGSAAIDYVVMQGELNKAELIVEPTFTGKVGLTYSNDFFKDKKMKTTVEMVQPKEYTKYLCSVPLISAAHVVEVKAAVYFKVAVSGEIVVSVKGSGKVGAAWNKNKKDFEGINTWSWQHPTIDASVTFEFGPCAALELHCALVAITDKKHDGKVISLEVFFGLVVNMTAKTSLGSTYSYDAVANQTSVRKPGETCFAVKVDLKLALTLKVDCDVLKDLLSTLHVSSKTGYKWELLSTKRTFFQKHYEIGRGFVDKCTYDSSFTVKFHTGTTDAVADQVVKGGGLAKEPKLSDKPGKLLGWYTKDQPGVYWNFDSDRILADTDLYADWELTQKTVTYHVNYTGKGGEIKDFTDTCKPGKLVSEPKALMWMDHRFVGWFSDKKLTKQWNFSTDKMPKKNLNLYAKWEYEKGYDPWAANPGSSSGGVVSFEGHTYQHIAEYMSYSAAVSYARSRGAYLATVNSKSEQDFLAKYLYDDCAQTYLWLGMDSTGGWTHWATGERITYTNWASAPKTTATQYNGALIRDSGQWTTLSNSDTAHFVMEWGAPVVDPGFRPEELDDISYAVDESAGVATVTGWNTDAKTLTISSTYQGLPVTRIISKAFQNNKTAQKIQIPNSITEIESSAFSGCESLKSITIPDSVTRIGDGAFENCTSLTSAVYSAACTQIPSYAFSHCAALKKITNIGAVTSIDYAAFSGCQSLAGLQFPSSLTSIDHYAFYGCSSLTQIMLPDSVTGIGSDAFCGCTSVTTISIGEGLTYIPVFAFSNCSAATSVTLPRTLTNIADSAFDGVDATFKLYRGTYAEQWAKENGKKISYLGQKYRVEFQPLVDGKKPTEKYVEAGVLIPEPVVSRTGYTIDGWYTEPELANKWNFARDVMPEHNLTLYAKWTADPADYDYSVADGKATIVRYLGSASKVEVPSKLGGYPVRTIAAGAFSSTSITSISIPSSVTSIAAGAFVCPKLYSVTVPGSTHYSVHDDGVLYNAAGTFLIYAPQGRVFTSYVIPDGVTKVGKRAFIGQTQLDRVTFPASVTSIHEDAFEGVLLLNVFGPNGSCAARTFAKNHGLSYNLYQIHYYDEDELVFSSQAEAGKLIGDYYKPATDTHTFGGWYRDRELTQKFDFAKDKMPNDDLSLYLKWTSLFKYTVRDDGNVTITGYRGKEKRVTIPEEIDGHPVDRIKKGAFTSDSITHVTVPACVTSIAAGAFADSITIIGDAGSAAEKYATKYGNTFSKRKYVLSFDEQGGSLVDDIKLVKGGKAKSLPKPIRDGYFFEGWYTDTSYTKKWTTSTAMPARDVTVYAYWHTANVNVGSDFSYKVLSDGTAEIVDYLGSKVALTVPDKINGYTVTRIGSYAFRGNDTVLTITLPTTVTHIGSYAFAGTKVRVVKGSTKLSTIGEGAFQNASALTSITLPKTLRTIGDSAFQGAINLTEAKLPEGTKTVGYRAYYGCSSLSTVTLPSTLTKIGKEAFAECPLLKSVKVPVALAADAEEAFDATCELSTRTSSVIKIQSLEFSGQNVTVTWNKVKGATSYAVETKLTSATAYKRKATKTGTKATFKLGSYGQTYHIRVLALDDDGKTVATSSAQKAYLSKLGTPAISKVTQRDANSATMVLVAVKGAEGYEVQRAFSSGGSFETLKTVTKTKFTNTGLIPGSDYFYRVRAFTTDEDGKKTYSRYSEEFAFHMPYKYLLAPTGLVVRQLTTSSVGLTWGAGSDAEGFYVYRNQNGGEFSRVKTILGNTPSFTDKNLKKGVKYGYLVRAFFTDEGKRVASPKSPQVTVTLKSVATPAITTITQSARTSVKLSWSSVKDASGYVVYMGKEGATLTAVKTVTSAKTTSATIGDLEVGKSYDFAVCAYTTDADGKRVNGNRSPRSTIELNGVADASGLSVSRGKDTTASLVWKKASGAAGYEVWMSANDEDHFQLLDSTTEVTYVTKKLNDGVTYYFKVRGYRGSDAKRSYGEFSAVESFAVVAAPTLKVAEQASATSVRLVWLKTALADGYEVYGCKGSGDFELLKDTTATNATITGLTSGKTYQFKVRAYTKVGSKKSRSRFSCVLKVYLIGSPKITSLKRSGTSKIAFSWSAATGADGYRVYRSDMIDGKFELLATTTKRSYSDTGLTVGQSYYYRITAYRGSKKVEGTPSAAKGMTLVPKPTSLVVAQSSATAQRISWAAVPGATKYQVWYSRSKDSGFKLLKTVTGKTAYTNKDLAANKWHYYKIVAGIDENGATTWGMASSVKGGYLTSLAKSKITSIKQPDATSAKITWKASEGATGYRLYRSNSEEGPFEAVKTLTGTSYTDKNLNTGQYYYWRVTPYKLVGETKCLGIASAVVGARLLGQTPIQTLERTASTSVTLAWDSDWRATGYKVYQSTSKTGTYKLVLTTGDRTATISKLTLDKTYYFKVAPYYENGVAKNIGPLSDPKGLKLYDIGTAQIKSVVQKKSGNVSVTWGTAKNAQGYELYVSPAGANSYTLAKRLTKTTYVVDTGLTDGSSYDFRVRAYKTVNSKRVYGSYSKVASLRLITVPTRFQVYQLSKTSVGVSWNAVEDATSYQVYRKEGSGSYEKIATTTSLSASDTGRTVGTSYSYKVRAVRKNETTTDIGGFTTPITIKPISYTPKKPYPESEHPYANNTDQTWTYTLKGVKALCLTFSEDTQLENGYDKLYIMDADGNYVLGPNSYQYWSGTSLAGTSVVVPGQTVTLRLTSDSIVADNGFTVVSITPAALPS